jgi:hypothetical protein
VVQKPPICRQHAPQPARVDVDLRLADVLDHADAGDRVELLAVQFAVVGDADVDELANACGFGAFTGDPRLRLAERDAGDVHAVVLRRVDRPAAPAAADVEDALARLELQLGADELELGSLRLFERGGAAAEDRAAVGHRLAEEQLEELGWQVVVVAHRATVARDAEWRRARASPRPCARSPAAASW